jgi:crossover junction endodeoxyribonuclease RuvC
MVIIGVDCGQTGAIAAYDGTIITGLIDMPTMARLHGKGQQVDPYTLATDILDLCGCMRPGDTVTAVIEAVSAMPGQGVSSMFRFGESVGVVLGVLGALQMPVRWVTPQRWKKAAGIVGKDKDAARSMAIQLHPEVADMLTRKKDHNRGEAILIARFGGER